jgi:hypothetical protein
MEPRRERREEIKEFKGFKGFKGFKEFGHRGEQILYRQGRPILGSQQPTFRTDRRGD